MLVKCACAPAECGGGGNKAPPLPHEGATEMVPVLAADAVLAKYEYISNPVAVVAVAAVAVKLLLLPLQMTLLRILPFESPPTMLRSVNNKYKFTRLS